MSDGRDFLPPDVRSLVDAERHRHAIPDDARVRLASKLASAVPAFGHGAGGSAPNAAAGGSAASGTSGASTVFGAAGAKVLVALSVVGIGAVGMHALPAARPVAPRVVVGPVQSVASVASVASAASIAFSASVPPAVDDSPRIVAVSPPAAVVRTAVSTSTRAEVSSAELAEERRLLDRARAAVVRGAPDEALPLLASHAERFPDGALAEERFALEIRALSRLGRTDEARTRLAALASRYPHSFLLKGATDDVAAPH